MPEWHPILAAVEIEPAVWSMRNAGIEYGRIELRRTHDGPRYRCEQAGEIIGWTTTLRGACMGVHRAYIANHGPSGPPNALRTAERDT